MYLLKNDDVVAQGPDSGALGVREELLSDPVEIDGAFVREATEKGDTGNSVVPGVEGCDFLLPLLSSGLRNLEAIGRGSEPTKNLDSLFVETFDRVGGGPETSSPTGVGGSNWFLSESGTGGNSCIVGMDGVMANNSGWREDRVSLALLSM